MNKCQVTGRSTRSGNNVSHSNRKTKRQYKANIHTKKVYLESQKRFITVKISARGLKTLEKKGVEVALKELGIIK